MRSKFILFLFLLFLHGAFFSAHAQGNSCETLEPFCAGDQELVFENSNFMNSNQVDGEPGPDYGCLLSQPFPAWFYLQIEEVGNLNFTISQFQNRDGTGAQYDVDFVVWGPFSRTDDYCSDEALSATNILDCSYAPDTQETMEINNAVEGDIYVVLITNFETQPGYISLRQTNNDQTGAGSTDCTILDSALGEDLILCGETETILDGTTDGATAYEWYVFNEDTDEYDLIAGEDESTLTVTTSGNYKVISIDDLNNETDEDDVNVSFYPRPVAVEPNEFPVCNDPGEANLRFLDDEILSENSSAESYRVVYYENEEDLENENPIDNAEALPVNEDTNLIAVVEGVESGCVSQIVDVTLVLNDFPDVGLEEITILCLDPSGNLLNPITIGEDLGENYNYEWEVGGEILSTQALLILTEVPETSTVNLTVTDIRSDCALTFTSEIEVYSAPEVVEIEIEGNDFEEGYTVTATSSGGIDPNAVYEYQLDNGSWQQENIFRRVPPGVHTITAREINGCGETSSEEFDLVGYPRFFTPNNDGYNDTWTIEGDEDIQVQNLYIFDRYGKLLKQLNPNGAGWDGTFNGRNLPADDYWFKLEYRDLNAGQDRKFGANFTLKR